MTNDKKSKVTVTLTRKEADWLLNLLDRETRSNTEGDPATVPSSSRGLSPSRAQHGFQAASLADRIRAEG
jgi:hypothetical protein